MCPIELGKIINGVAQLYYCFRLRKIFSSGVKLDGEKDRIKYLFLKKLYGNYYRKIHCLTLMFLVFF